jgi:hypothetical protein
MTNHSNSRRKFLALSGSATAAGLAGCMDFVSSETSDDSDDDSSSNGDDSNGGDSSNDNDGGYEPPEPQVETKYNSREEFRQPGDQLDDFENEDDWELLYGGEVEVDDETSFDGSQSPRLTAEDGGNVAIEKQIETTDMSDLDVSLAVRTSTPGNVGIDIRLLDIYGGYAHHQLRSVTYRTPDIGWFRICPGVLQESSTPLERDVINRIQITVYNTRDAEVWVDDLRTNEKPEKGYVMLCWDDGFNGFYDEASPLHDEYGVNAVQAVVRQ